jgi:hypothetical protein
MQLSLNFHVLYDSRPIKQSSWRKHTDGTVGYYVVKPNQKPQLTRVAKSLADSWYLMVEDEACIQAGIMVGLGA